MIYECMERNMDRHIKTPITEEMAVSLTYGDYVFISGSIYVIIWGLPRQGKGM